MQIRKSTYLPWTLIVACSHDPGSGWELPPSGGTEATSGSSGPDDSGPDGSGPDDSGPDGSGSDGAIKLDVATPDDQLRCVVSDGVDAPGPCVEQGPPNAFDPEVQWAWTSEDYPQATVMPLVANLSDDNDDARIDLCDTPDIVVTAYGAGTGRVHVLDGATGDVHFIIDAEVAPDFTPALGDVDGDGLPEIVVVARLEGGSYGLTVFNHDGTLQWHVDGYFIGQTVGLADFDNDGRPEIYGSAQIFDDQGNLVFEAPVGQAQSATAADLDGDGDLEFVGGAVAYHHDGSVLFDRDELVTQPWTQVADIVGDQEPDIVLSDDRGLFVLDRHGDVIFAEATPTGVPAALDYWRRPVAIHDVNGDGVAELLVNSAGQFAALEADATVLWQVAVDDLSGQSGGTAFDFLGAGTAQALFADEHRLRAYDAVGTSVFDSPRSSVTYIESPIVADVDNDGHAEIVVTSDRFRLRPGETPQPAVQVLRDREDRWVAARRIWNQHGYHVTNVLEDGRIPQFEVPYWKTLNTFRAQSQIDTEGGGVCKPEG